MSPTILYVIMREWADVTGPGWETYGYSTSKADAEAAVSRLNQMNRYYIYYVVEVEHIDIV